MQSVEEKRLNFINKLGTIWNKSEEEVEQLIKFDPVVRLLFNAIIFQYEDILNYHSEFKKEVLTDLGKRLMPDNLVSASPAFGIICADSVRNTPFNLRNDKGFSIPRKIKDQIVEQKFIPVSETNLIPGSLDVLIVNNTFIDIKANQEGEENYISKLESIEDRSIWLGLSLPKNVIDSIKRITLCINYDPINIDNMLFFSSLREANWQYYNKKCLASSGFAPSDKAMSFSPNSMGLGLTRQRILDFYKNNFITLQVKDREEEIKSIPSLPEALHDRSKHLIWVSAKCNSFIPSSFFTERNIHLNAFPVMNCDVKEGHLTKNEIIKGFRLEENEFFFNLLDTDVNSCDDFVVRSARYKSFDTKSLSMELRALSRLFNHSRASFDKASIIEEKEMAVFRNFSNIISDIDLRDKIDGTNAPAYSISSKKPLERTKEFRYLTTYGKYGNGGEIGEILKYEAPGLKAKSIKVLSPFAGGSDPVDEKELIDKFRYHMLSRDRIVSQQDIRALCYSIFLEENIENIKIKKTAIQGLGINGLRRALKIQITLKKTTTLDKREIDFKEKDLLAQLENNSTGDWPFILCIEKAS